MSEQRRLDAVRSQLEQRGLYAHLVTSIINVRYITGFTGSTGTAVITPDAAVMLVDSRYTLQASNECPLFEIKQFSGNIMTAAAELLNEMGAERVGFEECGVTYDQYTSLCRGLQVGKQLVPSGEIIDQLRLVKDEEEISLIRKAVEIADLCFSDLLTWLVPGIPERDIALRLEVCMRQHGAEKPAFDSIVAVGPHAALPHAQPGDAMTEAGQLVKLDYGAQYHLYPSDITRTIALGKATAKQKEIYQIVLDAQLAAIDAIRAGIPGRDIDAVARAIIEEKGYGENFGHGLGHSLGLGVHDGPGLSQTSNVVLEPGMVMTVEPGIYIEGWGGIRIEDDVVVTESGCEILSKSPKMELLVL